MLRTDDDDDRLVIFCETAVLQTTARACERTKRNDFPAGALLEKLAPPTSDIKKCYSRKKTSAGERGNLRRSIFTFASTEGPISETDSVFYIKEAYARKKT